MARAVSTLDAAVGGEHATLARRALGEIRDDAGREAAFDVLARHAAAGSRLAIELLIETVDRFGQARAAIRRVVVDTASVDEVVQDTLIAVALAIDSIPDDARFIAWLDQIAHDRAADHLRRSRSPEPGDAHEPSAASRLSALVASDRAVRRLLDEVPDRYRDAVLLRDIERLPYEEAATRLGRNVTTVRSHAARGRALLARLVEREGDRT